MEVKLYGNYYKVHFGSRFKRWLFYRLYDLKIDHISALGECAWIVVPEASELTASTDKDGSKRTTDLTEASPEPEPRKEPK